MALRIKVVTLVMAWVLLGGFALFLTGSIHLVHRAGTTADLVELGAFRCLTLGSNK